MSNPVTFREPSFVIYDIAEGAVRTTKWGSLAIFSTRTVAEQVLAQLPGCKIIPVMIAPITEH